VLPLSVAAVCPAVCTAQRCLETPMQEPVPRVRLRAESHMPATNCFAARNPTSERSQRSLRAPAERQPGATPPKFSAARSHCGRAPTYARVPLGAPPPLRTPFSRVGGNPDSRVAADDHQKTTVSRRRPHRAPRAAGASNGICGRSRPQAPEFHISRHLCDRQRNVCLTAIVPILVFHLHLDTIADPPGARNARKCTNRCPNDSGMVGR